MHHQEQPSPVLQRGEDWANFSPQTTDTTAVGGVAEPIEIPRKYAQRFVYTYKLEGQTIVVCCVMIYKRKIIEKLRRLQKTFTVSC